MTRAKFWLILTASVLLPFSPITTPASATSKYQVVHEFHGKDGANSAAALIFDGKGNLFGTTNMGGKYSASCPYGCGTVFELSPTSSGSWKEKVLHKFCSLDHCADGSFPSAGLTIDSAGNLFGTTGGGGKQSCNNGCGTVFELTPPSGNGNWSETVLHAFDGKDGALPTTAVVLDSAGKLYGTTEIGGNQFCKGGGCGTVFQLAPKGDGSWTAKVLYEFKGSKDGKGPVGGLVLDSSRALYGTTSGGGAQKTGTVYKLTDGGNGQWAKSILYNFAPAGGPSVSGLIFDAEGALYGTTSAQGGRDFGSVFKLTPKNSGHWVHTVLHTFYGKYTGGPFAGVIFDAEQKSLYGTTTSVDGAVFKLTPNSKGYWMLKTLHFFNEHKGGFTPFAGPVMDGKGNVYGTTYEGGDENDLCVRDVEGCGTVFEVTP